MMIREAEFSVDGKYRYRLSRYWEESTPNTVLFICLNPSTADAEQDDPTVRRLIGFAKDWGFDGMELVNLFAFRATSPDDMKSAEEPVGPVNDNVIRDECKLANQVVCAWGNHGQHLKRGNEVLDLVCSITKPYCFGATGLGQPKHPLYLRKDSKLVTVKWFGAIPND